MHLMHSKMQVEDENLITSQTFNPQMKLTSE
jgi:hypothetical protein